MTATSTAAFPAEFRSPDALKYPGHVWIEPTSRCNTKCMHCEHGYTDFGGDMSDDLFRRVMASVIEGADHIDLIGYGEPLIAKHFDAMLDECLRRGLKISTTTNGILLRSEKIAKKMVQAGMQLALSIDGARKETFESIRPLIKWEQMQKTLSNIRKAVEECGDTGFKLRFNFCLMKRNIGDLPDLVRLAHEVGAAQIFILPLAGDEHFSGVANESLFKSPELLAVPILKALKLAKELDVQLDVPHAILDLIRRGQAGNPGFQHRVGRAFHLARLALAHLKEHGAQHLMEKIRGNGSDRERIGPELEICTAPWEDTYIASDGKVQACCASFDWLGNLTEQSWDEIWHGSAYRNLRRTIHSWNPTFGCRFCALPMGINRGEEHRYNRFFAGFKREELALSDSIVFSEGFHDLERQADGTPSHIWMTKRGKLSIPVIEGAEFLRVHIFALRFSKYPNPGLCRIGDSTEEPFDDTCPEINFPISDHAGGHVELTFEMEKCFDVDGDPRELALGIRKFEYLLS